MKSNKLLVIVVTYNAMPWAEKCFTSLRKSSIPSDVIVVDNGSTDGSQDYIRTHFPEVELIENKENLGFGRANNIGLKKALDDNYEYAYLLNQDAWIFPDTFEKLIAVSQAHPEYGVLSPMQLKAEGRHFEDKFGRNVISRRQEFSPFFIDDMFFQRVGDVYEVSFVMAAHWLIPAKCLLTVGGFSPTFPHYGEDDNYLNRTNYWKFKIGIVPSAQAVHDRGDSNWSHEKEIYVNDFIGSLVSCSNPLDRESLGKKAFLLLKRGIRNGETSLIKYAYQLWRKKSIVEVNFKRSLKETAFLK